MILDEPTNHLDLESIEWLEEALRSFSGHLCLLYLMTVIFWKIPSQKLLL